MGVNSAGTEGGGGGEHPHSMFSIITPQVVCMYCD